MSRNMYYTKYMNNLTYQDALELKDAGFPQEAIGHDYVYAKGVRIPTLSELIEACGKDFISLVQRNVDQCWGCTGTGYSDVRGSTKEQAVKNLWIALNKK